MDALVFFLAAFVALAQAQNATVVKTDSGLERLYAEPDAGGLKVELKRVTEADGKLTLTARFSAQLGTSADHGRTIDASEPVPVQGEFDVTIEKLKR